MAVLRRKGISIEKMNAVFTNRGICQLIKAYVPVYEADQMRKFEVERFVESKTFANVLILDDDSSLRGLSEGLRKNWVEVNSIKGFDKNCLELAMEICGKWWK